MRKITRYKLPLLLLQEILFVLLIWLKYPTDRTTYINLQNVVRQCHMFVFVNFYSIYAAIFATVMFFICSSYLFHKYGGERMCHKTLLASFIPDTVQDHNYNGIPIYTALYQYPIRKRKYMKIALAGNTQESFPDTISCYYTSSKKDAVVDTDQLFSTLHIRSVLLRMFVFSFSLMAAFYLVFA